MSRTVVALPRSRGGLSTPQHRSFDPVEVIRSLRDRVGGTHEGSTLFLTGGETCRPSPVASPGPGKRRLVRPRFGVAFCGGVACWCLFSSERLLFLLPGWCAVPAFPSAVRRLVGSTIATILYSRSLAGVVPSYPRAPPPSISPFASDPGSKCAVGWNRSSVELDVAGS